MSEEKQSLYDTYVEEILKCRDKEAIEEIFEDFVCDIINTFIEAIGAATVASRVPVDFEFNAEEVGETFKIDSVAFYYLWHLITDPR